MNLALLLVVLAAEPVAPVTTAPGLSEPVEDGPAKQPAAATAPGLSEPAEDGPAKQPAAVTAPGLSEPVEDGPAKQPAATTAPAPATPAVEQRGLSVSAGPVDVKVNLAARFAQSLGAPIVLDETGTSTSATPFDMRFRLGPELRLGNFGLISEFDLATGAVFGTPESTIVAARQPTPNFQVAQLRQLYLQYRWQTGAARLGVQTNQFGMGMLANAGARDPEPGDFGLQHGGAVVARAGIAGRPLFGLGGAWRALEPVAAFDLIVNDSTANLLAGDRALQGILGLRYVIDEHHLIALTGVYRSARRPDGAPGERATDVLVADLYAICRMINTGDTQLTFAAELAYITGTTTQGRSDTAPVLDVRQFGGVGKLNFKKGLFGLLLDGGFASGDQNPYDTTLSSFRFDPNYKVGLVLFDQVLGYQSARSGWRAADPQLAGVPPEGIDLLPTAGAITGAWYLFPRAKVSPFSWLDVYGGPLFAFTTAALVDPFNTRLNGGTPVNALGARPGSYLGTELDLGVSVHGNPSKYLAVTATLEGGLLLPGDAFRTATGGTMPLTGLGRLRIALAL